MHQGIHIINLALKSALTLIIINNATITIRITMKYLLLHINHNMIQICIKHTKNVTCINWKSALSHVLEDMITNYIKVIPSVIVVPSLVSVS